MRITASVRPRGLNAAGRALFSKKGLDECCGRIELSAEGKDELNFLTALCDAMTRQGKIEITTDRHSATFEKFSDPESTL